MSNEPRLQMHCRKCGGTKVRRDADATWNTETQEWELAGLYDKGATCDDCGDECRIDERPL